MAMTIFLQQSACAATDTFHRCQASQVDPRIISQLKYDRSSAPNHKLSRLPDLNLGFILQIRRNMKNLAVVHASAPKEAPLPAHPSPGGGHYWKVHILGTIVAMLLSFSKGKWGPLLILKEKVETTIEELEQISDVVEEVADKVEEVAEAAAKHLPEGKLQDAAEFIDKLAEEIEKNAHLAGDLLEKVEDMGDEVDSFLDSNNQDKTVVSEEAKDHK
ncbi:uncharacterized protein LOC114752525 isoform X2 [Neltuma alba]|uniref:uncharacterized protein LOC114752525 isoform X2 n=1 Tax=Neltuma alba TaxID=207710 RepID=UPI0010A40CCD|nr:uncharacterized protein LOC114752525 isoform X2 [Prosopis alba]